MNESKNYECRAPWIMPIVILLGLFLIGLLSYRITQALGIPLPGLIIAAAPLALLILVASFRVALEAVRLQGGIAPFFCGGRLVLHDLLGHVKAEPPERIITSGPYSVARHPTYSATLAAYAGVSLVFPKALPGLLAVALWVYLAAWAEERILRKHSDYESYARRVPGIAPVRVILWALRPGGREERVS